MVAGSVVGNLNALRAKALPRAPKDGGHSRGCAAGLGRDRAAWLESHRVIVW